MQADRMRTSPTKANSHYVSDLLSPVDNRPRLFPAPLPAPPWLPNLSSLSPIKPLPPNPSLALAPRPPLLPYSLAQQLNNNLLSSQVWPDIITPCRIDIEKLPLFDHDLLSPEKMPRLILDPILAAKTAAIQESPPGVGGHLVQQFGLRDGEGRQANERGEGLLRTCSLQSHQADESPKSSPDNNHQGNNRPTIDCPVCGDVAIAHFHYGGMCCYSCKAFFRRVVNTSKASKYKCRSGNNKCDVSLANRRSCQACRYKKCLAAGMKPGLVLSEEQCQRRFGPRKGKFSGLSEPLRISEEVVGHVGVFRSSQQDSATEEEDAAEAEGQAQNKFDLRSCFDPKLSSEQQKSIGQQIFLSIFLTGNFDSQKLKRSVAVRPKSSLEEEIDLFMSFQIERQISHSRKRVSFLQDEEEWNGRIFMSDGRLNVFSIIQTLVNQTVMFLSHNKDFRSLKKKDQTLILENNVMPVTLLSCIVSYKPHSQTFKWKLHDLDKQQLISEGFPVQDNHVLFGMTDVLNRVENSLKDDVCQLFKFFDMFCNLGMPRSSLSLLILATVFNHDGCNVTDKAEVGSMVQLYLTFLFESLYRALGIQGACKMASRLHSALGFLSHVAQIFGEKFIDMYE